MRGNITEANFEGANIVLYTDNQNFFKQGSAQIRELVDELKKRIELRTDTKILPSKEETEKKIKEKEKEHA